MQSRLAISFGKPQARSRSTKTTRRRPQGFPLKRLLALTLLIGIGYIQLRGYLRQPKAVLVLGGATEREVFAAKFAQQHPDLPIWISSGSNPEYAEWVFMQAGVDLNRLHLDYQAVDTVTNFTTLVDEFKDRGIYSLYLITSDDHMRRARIIGELVLGSRGIDYRPIAVPSGRSPEPMEKAMRDAARAVLWLATGRTGSTVGRYLNGDE